MWNRQRLKRNARVLLKANYLKVVVVGFCGIRWKSDAEMSL